MSTFYKIKSAFKNKEIQYIKTIIEDCLDETNLFYLKNVLMIYYGEFDLADSLTLQSTFDEDLFKDILFNKNFIDPKELLLTNSIFEERIRKRKWLENDIRYQNYIENVFKDLKSKFRISYYFYKNSIKRTPPDDVINHLPPAIKDQLFSCGIPFIDDEHSRNHLKVLYSSTIDFNDNFAKTAIILLINSALDCRNFGSNNIIRTIQFRNDSNNLIPLTKQIKMTNLSLQHKLLLKIKLEKELQQFIIDLKGINIEQNCNLARLTQMLHLSK